MGKYGSSQSPSRNIEVTVPVAPENFSLSLNFTNLDAYPNVVGDRCRFSGQLLYSPYSGTWWPCPSERVDILVSTDGGVTWKGFKVLITDADGRYSTDWYPSDIGEYIFVAYAFPSPPSKPPPKP